jgi:predicted ATPase
LSRVTGAQELRLSGLVFPQGSDRSPGWIDRLRENEAVQLFCETARRVQPDFDLTGENAADVEELCRSLQGQPHPITLVARRMRHSTPADVADDPRGRPHQIEDAGDALWETIAWSYARLRDDQQQAFRQLCIFRDGFSREAADRVVRAEGLTGPRLRDAIGQMCDASLLECVTQGRTTRYWMYGTVQDYGLSLLQEEDALAGQLAR